MHFKGRHLFFALAFNALCLAATFGFTSFGGTTGGSMGSCAATNLGGSATGDSNSQGDTPSFSTGEPIDIPVPIAKNIPSVDATQFSFETGSSSRLIKGLTKEALATTTIRICGKTQESNVTVAVYVNGDLIQTIDVGSDLAFCFNTTDSIYGKPVAFVVRGPNNEVSYPVVVTPLRPEGPFEDIRTRIHITNITGIQDKKLAVGLNDVYYATEDRSSNPIVAISPIDGGFPEAVSSDPASLLSGMQVASDGSVETFAIGLEDDNTIDYVSLADGTTSTVGTSQGDLKLSPNGAYAASEELGRVVRITDLSDFTNTTQLTVGAEAAVQSLETAWVSDDILLVFKKFSSVSYAAQIYNLSSILGSGMASSTAVTPIALFTSTTQIRNPSIDPYTRNKFTYECADASGNLQLCFSNFTTQSEVVGYADGYTSIANSNWNASGDIVVFDAVTTAAPTGSRIVTSYLVDTDTIVPLETGSRPQASGMDANIVLYLSLDSQGNTQVTVYNLSLNADTAGVLPE